MKRILSSLLAVGLLAAVGCNVSKPGGTSGSAPAAGSSTTGGAAAAVGLAPKPGQFTISGPTLETNVKQGEEKPIALSVSRGEGATQTIKFSAESPSPKIKVSFAKDSLAAADGKEATMKVAAEKDAPLGHHVVKVKASPETGDATMLDVKIEVVKP
jgi:hypothetical protein